MALYQPLLSNLYIQQSFRNPDNFRLNVALSFTSRNNRIIILITGGDSETIRAPRMVVWVKLQEPHSS